MKPTSAQQPAAKDLPSSRRGRKPRVAPPDDLRLLHQLRVHQVELEVQNAELAQSRAAAEEAVARYTELYQLAPVAYLTLTPEGVITQSNRAATRLLGLDARHRRVRLRTLLNPGDVPACERFLQGVFSGQTQPAVPLRLAVRSGQRMTVQMEAIASEDGRECRAVLVETTERDRLAEVESELNQARRIHAIGRLAAGVAHEINNELASILALLGQTSGVLSPTPEGQRWTDRVGGCVERASSVVRRLLLFGRPAPLDIQRIDANDVVRDLLAFLRKTIGETFAITLDEAPGLLRVEADLGLLQQAILNLVLNARDAMPKGGRISIATSSFVVDAQAARKHPDRRPGRFVGIAVTDHGCGIGSGDLVHIFEPFFTTKKVGVGTGLGLPMVRDTVVQHHGWVDVDSSPGQGSTFRICLPALVDGSQRAARAPSRAPSPALRGHETLLLVDDSDSLRQFLGEYLESLGYRVLKASTGPEAIRAWKRQRADLLLADMVMPGGMTGRQLAGRLRKDDPGLPVIISSGYNPDASAAGPKGILYLPKPASVVVLAAAIRERLNLRSGAKLET